MTSANQGNRFGHPTPLRRRRNTTPMYLKRNCNRPMPLLVRLSTTICHWSRLNQTTCSHLFNLIAIMVRIDERGEQKDQERLLLAIEVLRRGENRTSLRHNPCTIQKSRSWTAGFPAFTIDCRTGLGSSRN
ncbi:MAG: hypothetical protein LZF60_80197 [Nitrospira sp.]|nr:MAG: hypothetical protein LZF60_80197 [Nitrospira sp.]